MLHNADDQLSNFGDQKNLSDFGATQESFEVSGLEDEKVDADETIVRNRVQLHLYKLRKDHQAFSEGHSDWLNEDFCEEVTSLSNNDCFLTPEEIQLTLSYFVQCGNRLRQMAMNFSDPEATISLIQEKEKDLQLAASIGLNLLRTNDELRESIDALNQELTESYELINQLKYTVNLNKKIINTLNEERDVEDLETSLSEDSNRSSKISNKVDDNLQAWTNKVEELEVENQKLRNDASILRGQTKYVEDKEQKLIKNCVQKLAQANSKLSSAYLQITKKTEECNIFKEDVQDLTEQTVKLNKSVKFLEEENSSLKERLQEGLHIQSELKDQLIYLEKAYAESVRYLEMSREESKRWQRAYSLNSIEQDNANMFHISSLMLPQPPVEVVPTGSSSTALDRSDNGEAYDCIETILKKRVRRQRRSVQHPNTVIVSDESVRAQLDFARDLNNFSRNIALDRSTDSGVQSDAESMHSEYVNQSQKMTSTSFNRSRVMLIKADNASTLLTTWKELNQPNVNIKKKTNSGIMYCVGCSDPKCSLSTLANSKG